MIYYKRIDKDGHTITVEAYSHSAEVPGAIECPRQEFDDFVNALPIPAKQPDRLSLVEQRLDALELKIGSLDAKVSRWS